jgi:hypothetical protein
VNPRLHEHKSQPGCYGGAKENVKPVQES